MTIDLHVLVNIWLASIFKHSRAELAKYGTAIIIKVGMLVLTSMLFSTPAQMKVRESHPNIISSKKLFSMLPSGTPNVDRCKYIAQNTKAVLPTQTKFWIEPPSSLCLRTFLRVSTCSATCWGLVQAEDETEEAKRHQMKVWKASKVCYTECHKLFRTSPVEGCGATMLVPLSGLTARACQAWPLPGHCKGLLFTKF